MIRFFFIKLPLYMMIAPFAIFYYMMKFSMGLIFGPFKLFYRGTNTKTHDYSNNFNPATYSKVIKKLANVSDGIEFENYCAYLLRRNGFRNVRVTQASNDYGTDILAEKDNLKYAFQCKFYSSPVGVSAIQEINAGKTYWECHVAVVITNSTFTKNAIELAEKTNVLLWDVEKLAQLMK